MGLTASTVATTSLSASLWNATPTTLAQLAQAVHALDSCPATVPYFHPHGQLLAARCVKVYDGDTCHFVAWIAGQWIRLRYRLAGVDAPEINGPDNARAIAARDYLANLIIDRKVVLYLHDLDKYGRPLCDVYLLPPALESQLAAGTALAAVLQSPENHVNHLLLATGHAVPYEGGTRGIAAPSDDEIAD